MNPRSLARLAEKPINPANENHAPARSVLCKLPEIKSVPKKEPRNSEAISSPDCPSRKVQVDDSRGSREPRKVEPTPVRGNVMLHRTAFLRSLAPIDVEAVCDDVGEWIWAVGSTKPH